MLLKLSQSDYLVLLFDVRLTLHSTYTLAQMLVHSSDNTMLYKYVEKFYVSSV